MELHFEDYLSAKMRQDVILTVFPAADPQDFLKEQSQKEGGESVATTCVYDFPDTAVVIARHESGGAVIMPDEPVDVLIDVHIGPKAAPDTIAAAEQAARQMADEAGVSDSAPEEETFDFTTGLSFIRH